MEIQDTNGRWLYQTVDIGQSFIWYYSELFFLFEPHQVQEALENIPQVVTKPSNFDLIGTFHEWVVLDALKQMAPLKAPSLNGMPPLFYQHF